MFGRKATLPLMLALSLAAVASVTSETSAQGSGGTVRFVVSGVRSEKGRVHVLLWSRDDGYPRRMERAARKASGPISGGRAVVVFDDLPAGTWAAFAFHDEDGDGQLRKSFIGMPREGVGASRNARGRMGPPSFEAAAFTHGAEPQTQRIRLRYL